MADVIERFSGANLQIAELTPADAEAYGPSVQRLLSTAWINQFVGQVGGISEEDLQTKFSHEDPAQVEERITQLGKINSANRYLVAESIEDVSLVGLIRVINYKPCNPMKFPYPYIHDIDVDPLVQGRGIGSLLMNRALAPFRSNRRVALYVYEGNPIIEWYEKLGFEHRRQSASAPFLGGAIMVNELHYEAAKVQTVRRRLEPSLDKHGFRTSHNVSKA